MEGIGLRRFWQVFGAWNVQIHYDGFLAAAHDYGFDRLVFSSIKFLVREVGRNVHKIARTSFVYELELIAPTKASTAANHINDRFELTMMMRAGFGVGINDHGSSPKFLCANLSVGDGLGPSHSRSLWRVGIELAAADDTQTMVFPVGKSFRH